MYEHPPINPFKPPANRASRIIWGLLGGLVVATFAAGFVLYPTAKWSLDPPKHPDYTLKKGPSGIYRVTFLEPRISLDLPMPPRSGAWDVQSSDGWFHRMSTLCSWNETKSIYIRRMWLTDNAQQAVKDIRRLRRYVSDFYGPGTPIAAFRIENQPPRAVCGTYLNKLVKPPIKNYCIFIPHEGILVQLSVAGKNERTALAAFKRVVRSTHLD
ncbi:MAG: hypothetical protein ABL949_11365 [Fimbriimonadaceae bacterium]